MSTGSQPRSSVSFSDSTAMSRPGGTPHTLPTPESERMTGIQTMPSAAITHGGLPISGRVHSSNRFGLRPPPPSQSGNHRFLPLLDLPAVNVRLIDSPITAPENTPAPSAGASDGAIPQERLPSIAEVLQRLPELSSDVSSAATTLAEPGMLDEEEILVQSSPLAPSSPTFNGRSSTPLTQHGVREHTDWQEDVEADLDRALARLANLARDDHEQDTSSSVEQHYTRRLDAAIERQHTRYTYLQEAKSTITTLLLHRAKLRSLLEAIATEVAHDNKGVVDTVTTVLAEIDDDDEVDDDDEDDDDEDDDDEE
ncbi:uncharacterized protein BKCO1_3700039 [Diplodia corticola]|uniref:Uncharacterized protein n=1 Tax=Diplodia corticola TaxID=236234 RepID=A0A1J9RXY5_9PEZI|nr:uncharacterized protein BKCO1_3700039 [Diplodia corticola]OJD32684.1 hypothetical protein BKCO1_3700039 [Diplodia corticola]